MTEFTESNSPARQQPIESLAPITYCTLQGSHLDQIHDLLQRVFWTGIDGEYVMLPTSSLYCSCFQSVSDSLEFSPERCTIVACYKKLVVGVAILSSPQETYMTYLAVKAGWDKAQIARLVSDKDARFKLGVHMLCLFRTMLFHIIRMNPQRDITLHVSANNSAMVNYLITAYPLLNLLSSSCCITSSGLRRKNLSLDFTTIIWTQPLGHRKTPSGYDFVSDRSFQNICKTTAIRSGSHYGLPYYTSESWERSSIIGGWGE